MYSLPTALLSLSLSSSCPSSDHTPSQLAMFGWVVNNGEKTIGWRGRRNIAYVSLAWLSGSLEKLPARRERGARGRGGA